VSKGVGAVSSSPTHTVPVRNPNHHCALRARGAYPQSQQSCAIAGHCFGDFVDVIENRYVEAFCVVVGNQQERFKTVGTDEVKVPVDYAIATGRQAIAKVIFPSAIDGHLLKLVHLSNGFKMIPSGHRNIHRYHHHHHPASFSAMILVSSRPVFQYHQSTRAFLPDYGVHGMGGLPPSQCAC
jgi:hypothetical protein